MTTAEWITASLVFIIAAILAVVSIRSFQNKGFLFNNAYIYASKQEREAMDKKPHYKQSGIVFVFIGMIFLINAIDTILQTGWLNFFVIGIAVIAIVYAIVSSVIVEKRKK